MKQIKLACLLLIVSFLLSHTHLAHGHAVVTEHSLKITPVQAGKASQVSLDFNSQIELGLSRFYLVKVNDESQPVKFSAGTKAGQVILALPPLNSGDYALSFKVLAADGHISEDIIHFTVKP